MRFFHASDIHLGAAPDRKKPWSLIRKQEIYESFSRLIDEANRQQIDFLFLSGDVFHKPPGINDIREFDYILQKLVATKTVFIAGNHDYLSENSPLKSYDFLSDTYLLDGKEVEYIFFEEEETYVYGFSYWQQEITDSCYEGIAPVSSDGYHILLAHGGDAKHVPIDYEELKWSGFDYIALGHIHKPDILVEDLMAYPGSLEPLDQTETGPHGYIEGEISEEKQRITFVPFAKRSYLECEIPIHDEMVEMQIYDRIRNEILLRGAENYFYLTLSGNLHYGINLDFSELEEKYQIIDIDNQLTEFGDYDELLSANRDNIVGKVMLKLEDEPKALSYAMKALLSTAKGGQL
ncbi:MAG: DNA repair exonuclease [Lachnospiraceae bacterium]|nr:DNA repair exonuclease [Lachnospiraceae bacterium]